MQYIKTIILTILIISCFGCNYYEKEQCAKFSNGDMVVTKIGDKKCMVIGMYYNFIEFKYRVRFLDNDNNIDDMVVAEFELK